MSGRGYARPCQALAAAWLACLMGGRALAEESLLGPWRPAPETLVRLQVFERLRGAGMTLFGNPIILGREMPTVHSYGLMTNRLQVSALLEHADWLEGEAQFQNVTVAGDPDRYYNPGRLPVQNGAYLREGWLKLKQSGFFLSGGRQPYADGAETPAREKHLHYLQNYQLSQRLIGTLEFSPSGRSFDGARLGHGNDAYEFSGFYLAPTCGGLNVQGMCTIDGIRLAGASLNLKETAGLGLTLGRLGAYHYQDTRPKVWVAQNRPDWTPGADISVQTLGGYLTHVAALDGDHLDLSGFAFGQFGRWQGQDQQAWAYGVELGYEWAGVWSEPWLRVGVNSGSGDDNPLDGVHGTFFQMLPSTPIQAPFPFYNLMNAQDVFLQLLARPLPMLGLRLDLHAVTLNSGQDLWYTGSGAGSPRDFGFFGQPAWGATDLAYVTNIGASLFLSREIRLNFFYGHAFGQAVIARNHSGTAGDFGLGELVIAY